MVTADVSYVGPLGQVSGADEMVAMAAHARRHEDVGGYRVKDKTTYALLIYRTAPAEPSPEDSERALVGHRALQKEAEASGDLRAVARLAGVETARTIRRRGGAHDVTDGPYIDTKEWLVGFYLVDCVDEAEATARARTICPLDDHAIEVRPVTWRREP